MQDFVFSVFQGKHTAAFGVLRRMCIVSLSAISVTLLPDGDTMSLRNSYFFIVWRSLDTQKSSRSIARQA